jgi:hypothetical protein
VSRLTLVLPLRAELTDQACQPVRDARGDAANHDRLDRTAQYRYAREASFDSAKSGQREQCHTDAPQERRRQREPQGIRRQWR